jgi:L-lactate permease
MTTASTVIGVVIPSVTAAMIWRVEPRVASRLEPKEILTVAGEETKENESETYIIHKTSLPLRMVLLWLGHVIVFCVVADY